MKTAVAVAALLALALPASAAPITGELSLTGTNNTDVTVSTITFTSANPTTALEETGDFTALGAGGAVTFRNTGTPINYLTGLTSGSNLSCGAGCIFTAVNNGITASMDLTSASATVAPGGFVDISGSGLLALTGHDTTPGVFFLSTQGGSGTNLTFSSTAEAVPGPIAGAGLPGLIAAGGLLALARRRRNNS